MTAAEVLTPQQRAFCEHYVANGRNGTQAAIVVGYAKASAHVRAHKLLAMAKVQAYIAELVIPAAAKALDELGKKEAALGAKAQEIAAREDVVAAQESLEQLRERVRARLINRLVDMGFAVAGDVATWTEGSLQFIPSAELTPEAMGSVKAISARISEGESQDGEKLWRNVHMDIKQHDPMRAMKMLAQLLELTPKAAPAGKAESSGGVIIVVAGGPTGLELGAQLAAQAPIAVVAAPGKLESREDRRPTETQREEGGPAPSARELRSWNPRPKKKKLVPGVTAPRSAPHVVVSRPTGSTGSTGTRGGAS